MFHIGTLFPTEIWECVMLYVYKNFINLLTGILIKRRIYFT